MPYWNYARIVSFPNGWGNQKNSFHMWWRDINGRSIIVFSCSILNHLLKTGLEERSCQRSEVVVSFIAHATYISHLHLKFKLWNQWAWVNMLFHKPKEYSMVAWIKAYTHGNNWLIDFVKGVHYSVQPIYGFSHIKYSVSSILQCLMAYEVLLHWMANVIQALGHCCWCKQK